MSSSKTKRINARVTEEVQFKLASLVRSSGSSMSDIITEAIERYYAESSQSDGAWFEIVKQSGFVGSGQGPRNLSKDYKKLIGKSLGEKFGYR